jgi:ABC-2 type transport system ATP-binding protein
MVEMVGLTHSADRHVGGYSLGMRQRLGLAAALLGDPPVLVLDEPGNGLDPQVIRWLRDLLRERAAAGGTVFVSSHLLAEVEHLADDVVVISVASSSRPAPWPPCNKEVRRCAPQNPYA